MNTRSLAITALFSLGLLSACSRAPGPGINAATRPGENQSQTFPEANTLQVTGRLIYERKDFFTDATGQHPSLRHDDAPIRLADVVAIDATTNQQLQFQAGSSDFNGRFTISLPRGHKFLLGVIASTLSSRGRANIVVRDVLTGDLFMALFTDPATGGPFSVDPRNEFFEVPTPLRVALTPNNSPPSPADRPAAPFHIMDSALDESEVIRNAGGNAPPLVTFLWNATSNVGSFFETNVPPFGPAIFLLGGDTLFDNTDDQDVSVIRHEYGHSVANAFSKDASLGGAHGSNDVLYPSLAYSEGFADFISGVVGQSPAYTDSVGPDNPAPFFFVLNLEDPTLSTVPEVGPRTIRRESTVFQLLWRTVAGANGLPDLNADGLAVPFASFFRGFIALRNQLVYPSLEDLLKSLVATGAVTNAQVQALLTQAPVASITFPPSGTDVFPTPVAIPGTLTDACRTIATTDVVNDGIDAATRIFSVTVPTTETVTFKLTLLGVPGTNASGTNVDMNVRQLDNTFADATANFQLTQAPGPQTVTQTASGTLAPATYIVEITGRPFDPVTGAFTNKSGQMVNYRLDVTSP